VLKKDGVFNPKQKMSGRHFVHKIKGMINDLGFEMEKRKIFTYEMGKTAEKNKAETSLLRAKRFFVEIEKIIRT
jgi:hypothetical protein